MSIDAITETFRSLQDNAQRVNSSTVKERRKKLLLLGKNILNNQEEIVRAAQQDFHRPSLEVKVAEILFIMREIRHVIKKIGRWMKLQKVPSLKEGLGTSSHVQYESKGVVLIITPWNYPFSLSFSSVISAVAAGNCVVLKPSELSPESSRVIKNIVSETFSENEVVVMNGDSTVSQALLTLPFNHIHFTGSPTIGKIVMGAASKNLSSVTLELGGKSPVFVDETADLKQAASAIAWAKFCNAGQTCIAPDYLYVHRSIQKSFLQELKTTLDTMYTYNAHHEITGNNYATIVNQKHYQRVHALLDSVAKESGSVFYGGFTNAEKNFISPTIVTNVTRESSVMQAEIFGPILPVLEYQDINGVIATLEREPTPLSLYIFSKSRKRIRHILDTTKAGGVTVNSCFLHFSNFNLPFGGHNNSGIGRSHGHYGFVDFSNVKSIFKQKVSWYAAKMFVPPTSTLKEKIADFSIRHT